MVALPPPIFLFDFFITIIHRVEFILLIWRVRYQTPDAGLVRPKAAQSKWRVRKNSRRHRRAVQVRVLADTRLRIDKRLQAAAATLPKACIDGIQRFSPAVFLMFQLYAFPLSSSSLNMKALMLGTIGLKWHCHPALSVRDEISNDSFYMTCNGLHERSLSTPGFNPSSAGACSMSVALFRPNTAPLFAYSTCLAIS